MSEGSGHNEINYNSLKCNLGLNILLIIIFIHQLDGRLNIIMKVNVTNYNHAVHKVKNKARHALVDKREHKTTTPYIT